MIWLDETVAATPDLMGVLQEMWDKVEKDGFTPSLLGFGSESDFLEVGEEFWGIPAKLDPVLESNQIQMTGTNFDGNRFFLTYTLK